MGFIDLEIKNIKLYRDVHMEFDRRWKQLEMLRRGLPDCAYLDRKLRYLAYLDRNLERTLTQLERAQRQRLGLPLPPEMNPRLSR